MNFDCKVCSKCNQTMTANEHLSHKCKPINFNWDKVQEEMKKYWYCECGEKYNKDGLCWKCEDKKKKEKKRRWLVDRKYKMTMEERIAALESFMYEMTQGDMARQLDNMRLHTTVFR